MEQLSTAVCLIIAHLLGDFYLQPNEWVQSRNTRHLRSPTLYYHALLHGALAFFVLLAISVVTSFAHPKTGFADIAFPPLLLVAGGIAVSHFVIDAVKSYAKPTVWAFIIDQIAHLAVIIVLWALFTHQLTLLLNKVLMLNYKHLIVVLAYLGVLKPASIFIKQLLSPWSQDLEGPSKPSQPKTLVYVPVQNTLAMAGQRIGYLERLLILTFVLVDQFAAIGFLVAAKSIFRFGDLTKSQDKKLTEYVLLGTLTSVLITLTIGLSARWFIT